MAFQAGGSEIKGCEAGEQIFGQQPQVVVWLASYTVARSENRSNWQPLAYLNRVVKEKDCI